MTDPVETALERLEAHLSPEAEAERVRRHEVDMRTLRAIRAELGQLLGVGAKE